MYFRLYFCGCAGFTRVGAGRDETTDAAHFAIFTLHYYVFINKTFALLSQASKTCCAVTYNIVADGNAWPSTPRTYFTYGIRNKTKSINVQREEKIVYQAFSNYLFLGSQVFIRGEELV